MMPPPEHRMKLPGEEIDKDTEREEMIKQSGISKEVIDQVQSLEDMEREGKGVDVKGVQAKERSLDANPHGRPTKQPQLLKDYTVSRVVELTSQGMTPEKVGKIVGVNQRTVANVIDQLSGFSDISKLIKTVGLQAANCASLAYIRLSERLQSDAEMARVPVGSLAVIAGITTDKMNATLNKPAPGAAPQWEALEPLPQDQAA